jgi:hypothetical protein
MTEEMWHKERITIRIVSVGMSDWHINCWWKEGKKMSDVTGPISSLPGSIHKSPMGKMCDNCPEKKAVIRIQGETDSFGSEMHDLCQECSIVSHAGEFDQTSIGFCNWCGKESSDLKPTRDYEEGSCGPIYHVCAECIRLRNEDAQKELELWTDEIDFEDWREDKYEIEGNVS